MISPSQFPPPYTPNDYIATVTSPEEQRLKVGVLIVGGGPAGLACAVRLGQLLKEAPEIGQSLGDFPVAILEKGK